MKKYTIIKIINMNTRKAISWEVAENKILASGTKYYKTLYMYTKKKLAYKTLKRLEKREKKRKLIREINEMVSKWR